MYLIDLKEMYLGETAEIVFINSDIPEVKRIMSMGIREGKLVDLLHYDSIGLKKLVLGVDNTRIAFDIDLANHIRVRPIKSYFDSVKKQAHYDNLTSCLNRHAANSILIEEYEKFKPKRFLYLCL